MDDTMTTPKDIRIGSRIVGVDAPVFIIAEIGVNHNGDVELAKRMIRAAKAAGADCAKFQTFQANQVAVSDAPKADYQKEVTDPKESQINMLKQLELPELAWCDIMDYCREVDIEFLSTPYSFDDANLLESLGAPAFKVASGQAVELPFLRHLAAKGKPVLLSTGMCSKAEVDAAVGALRAGGNDQIIVLQCTTNYPADPRSANLRAMQTMGEETGCLYGYSDHTPGMTTAIASVAMGSKVLERHFTLDRNMPGPDHSSSMEPDEFARLVEAVREVEASLGSGRKEPCPEEERNIRGMRRSLRAKHSIVAGEPLSWDNLCYKRPQESEALAPETVLGKIAARDIEGDTLITMDMLQ